MGATLSLLEIENLVDGESVSLVKIESITVNPGILSFYFEVPKV